MILHVEDYAPRLRDSQVERELAGELKNLSEADRLQFICELMEVPHCFGVAMRLVKTNLKERQSLEAILTQGLERGDASTIKHWLEAVVHGLGFPRVVRLISERITDDPSSVIKAEYHLRTLVPDDDPKAADAMAKLHACVEQIMRDNPVIESTVRPFKATLKKSD